MRPPFDKLKASRAGRGTAGQSRRGSKVGICDRGAILPGGMQLRCIGISNSGQSAAIQKQIVPRAPRRPGGKARRGSTCGARDRGATRQTGVSAPECRAVSGSLHNCSEYEVVAAALAQTPLCRRWCPRWRCTKWHRSSNIRPNPGLSCMRSNHLVVNRISPVDRRPSKKERRYAEKSRCDRRL